MAIKNQIILGGNPVILDIGTYDGADSIEFLDKYSNARVFAFEADLRSIDLFKHSISTEKSLKTLIDYYNIDIKTPIKDLYKRINSSKLTLVKKAISNINGKTTWYSSNQTPPLSKSESERGLKAWSASSSINKPKNHLKMTMRGNQQIVEFNNPIEVPSIKLDTWFESQSDINFIDFIWADVNGGEKELILGGLNTLKNHVGYLYTEYSNNELMEGQPTLNEILDMLDGTFTCLEKNSNGIKGMYGTALLKNINK